MRPARPLRCETRAGSSGSPSACVTMGESPSHSRSCPALDAGSCSVTIAASGLCPLPPYPVRGKLVACTRPLPVPLRWCPLLLPLDISYLLTGCCSCSERAMRVPLWEIRVRAKSRIEYVASPSRIGRKFSRERDRGQTLRGESGSGMAGRKARMRAVGSR